MIRTHKYYLSNYSCIHLPLNNNAKEHYFRLHKVVQLSKVGSVSTPYLICILGFTGIRHGLYAHCYFHCLSTIDGICFLRNPLPATHMYIIHSQPTPIFLRECIRLTMLICHQIRQEEAPTYTPANYIGLRLDKYVLSIYLLNLQYNNS